MGHLQAAGSQISEGDQSERLIIGGLEGIPSSVFPSQITYGALGHIHREQQIANRNEIRYALAVRYPCLLQKKITATE